MCHPGSGLIKAFMRNRLIILFFLSAFAATLSAGMEKPAETIFLKTDRDIYVSGEPMFFTAWRQSDPSPEMINSNYAYMVMRDGLNRTVGTLRMRFSEDQFSGAFYLPDTLQTGYYQMVLFTNYLKNFGEGKYFTKEIIVVNRFDEKLNSLQFSDSLKNMLPAPHSGPNEGLIIIDKQQYAHREKVSLQVRLPENIKNPAVSGLTVRLKESLLREAELQQSVIKETATAEAFANLKYFPETTGIFLYGMVTGTDGRAIPRTQVFVSVPDTVANLFYVSTDESGEFAVLLNEYYMGREVFFNLGHEVEGNISLYDRFSLEEDFVPHNRVLSSETRDHIHLARNIVNVQKAFPLVLDFSAVSPQYNYIPKVYAATTVTVYPSDYLYIENLLELSREILPAVRTRKRGDSYSVQLKNEHTESYFDLSPLILYNGVPVAEIDPLIPLDSDEIRKIEYIAHERFLGDIMFYGILAVFTREPSGIADYPFPQSTKFMVSSNHPSLDVFNGNQYPEGKEGNASVPDFRQTLYWNSGLVFSPEGMVETSFYCPDIAGDYIISFFAVSEDGEIIALQKEIRIGS